MSICILKKILFVILLPFQFLLVQESHYPNNTTVIAPGSTTAGNGDEEGKGHDNIDGGHTDDHSQSWGELPFAEKCDVLLLILLYLVQGCSSFFFLSSYSTIQHTLSIEA
jgi:hypothetical protein